jgi:uncharacterized hydrophobic protein (TIGR00341 family)
MTAKLVAIFVSDSDATQLEGIIQKHSRRYWREVVDGQNEKYSCIVQQRYVERLIVELNDTFGENENFLAYVSSLNTVIPRIRETVAAELPVPSRLKAPTWLERFFSRDRVSTDELYDDIEESLRIRPTFLLTVALSAVIAGLGMRSGQTAVVIGAMIIAPLLGPTMGIALAATVGDWRLGRRSITTLGIGCLLAVLVGGLVGMVLAIDPSVAELRNRTLVQPADVALALACGAAGVLALSRGASLALVGVMIAVALVPPLAAAGIYAGAGYPGESLSALFLFAVNIVCINVAGILTFLLQGLPPKDWRLTGGILGVWILTLLLLSSMIVGGLVFQN